MEVRILSVNGRHPVQVIAWTLVLFSGFGGNASAHDLLPRSRVEQESGLLSPEVPIGSVDAAVTPASFTAAPGSDNGFSAEKLKKLMRPTFNFGAKWYAETDDIGLATYDAKVSVPMFPVFGPPPPFLNAGFAYTDLNAPTALDLPSELYTTSLGLAWMRRWNERWLIRSMVGVANATDGNNSTSDSWQFRGGIFAIYKANQEWTWTFGALALGRNDIPVVPAVGAIYERSPGLRFDFTFPRPRVSVLLVDNGWRQQWGYLGATLNGGSWGYQRAGGINDQLTYRDWQVVLGWESTPRLEPGMPFARGRKLGVEIGYAFSREFEFESELADIPLGDTIMLRATMSF